MQLLESYNEYKYMVREIREKYRRPFSNVYFMPADMERYIRLGRVGYERTESGILLYFDEERYYRVCLCVDEREPFVIERQNKKVLVKNVFFKGEKRESMQRVEQQLEELGFEYKGTSVKVKGELKKIFQRCKRVERYADALDKRGYRFMEADASMTEKIEAIILDSDIIKDYQLNFWTVEEKKEMAEKGCYSCILDENNKICGGGYYITQGDTAIGIANAIKEEYKRHGLAPVSLYHAVQRLHKKGITKAQGWILLSNKPSIKYHQSLNYEFTDEHADEWILTEY